MSAVFLITSKIIISLFLILKARKEQNSFEKSSIATTHILSTLEEKKKTAEMVSAMRSLKTNFILRLLTHKNWFTKNLNCTFGGPPWIWLFGTLSGVYFDQHLAAVHSKCWLKSEFSHLQQLFDKNFLKIRQNEIIYGKYISTLSTTLSTLIFWSTKLLV